MSDIYLEDLINKTEMVSAWDYQYWKGLKNRRVLLMGEINSTLAEEVIIPLIDMDNDGSGKEIELIVDSEGGDVISTYKLIDVLDTIKTPVHIKVLTKCCSAALLLCLGGKHNPNVRVTCSPNSVGLLHSGSVGLNVMDAKAADDLMDFYKKYDIKTKDLVLSRTKVDSKLYAKMSKKEWYMFGDELLKYGFVDALENHAEGGGDNA
jgi:ATP-dependent protease ClpP protease subunit